MVIHNERAAWFVLFIRRYMSYSDIAIPRNQVCKVKKYRLEDDPNQMWYNKCENVLFAYKEFIKLGQIERKKP